MSEPSDKNNDNKNDNKNDTPDTKDPSEDWKTADFLAFDDDDDDDNEGAANTTNNKSGSDNNVDGGVDQHREAAQWQHQDLPPWMQFYHPRVWHPLIKLHNEVVQFTRLVEPTGEESLVRDELVDRIRKLVRRTFPHESPQLKIFGSQATGLFLPDSDIDLVVLIKENNNSAKRDDDNDNSAKEPQASPLQRLGQALREEWLHELSYLDVIENTRVPLVKFTHAPTQLDVDICFNQVNGVPAANLMKTYISSLPPLRPLTFVLKAFLRARSLDEPYTGGMGSYMLQLLIVAFLQQREREAQYERIPMEYGLGHLLVEFFEFYGTMFNYWTTGISVRHDGFFFAKGAEDRWEHFCNPARPNVAAVENPLDVTMDVGGSTFRYQTIQRAFALTYRTLLVHMTNPREHCPASLLETFLPPTKEWYERQAWKNNAIRAALQSPRDDRQRKKRRKE